MDTMVWAPATTEHSEEEETDPKQKAKPGENCRYEEGCLNISILSNIYLIICYPSYGDQDTRWNINHDKERSDWSGQQNLHSIAAVIIYNMKP